MAILVADDYIIYMQFVTQYYVNGHFEAFGAEDVSSCMSSFEPMCLAIYVVMALSWVFVLMYYGIIP